MTYDSVLRLLAAVSEGRWVLLSDRHDHVPGQTSEPDVFYPIQRHTVPELAMITHGDCLVYIEGSWHHPPGETMLAFLPGAWHMEKWTTRETSYSMLWLTVLPQGINLHFSAYAPAEGYHLAGDRLTFQLPSAPVLWEASTQPDIRENIKARACFLSHLMQELVEMLERLDRPSQSAMPHAQQLAEQVRHYIDAHFRSDVTLRALAEMVHYSPAHLNLIFRRHVGQPIHSYLLDQRLEHAKGMLTHSENSIKEAARESGFADPLYFSRLFRRRTGLSPTEFQQVARNRQEKNEPPHGGSDR